MLAWLPEFSKPVSSTHEYAGILLVSRVCPAEVTSNAQVVISPFALVDQYLKPNQAGDELASVSVSTPSEIVHAVGEIVAYERLLVSGEDNVIDAVIEQYGGHE